MSQKQIKPLVAESTPAIAPVALNKEDSVKPTELDGDFSEFSAEAMKQASHEEANRHTLTAEDLQNIIGDNSNVQLKN